MNYNKYLSDNFLAIFLFHGVIEKNKYSVRNYIKKHSIAAPILYDMNIPATFYITTDLVKNNIMGWSDRIEYCFENTDKAEIIFPWDNKKKYYFSNQKEKIELLDYIRYYVKNNSNVDHNELVSSMFSQCNITEIFSNDDPLDLKLNWKQITDLNNNDLFIIGGHSHRHSILSFLDSEELDEEIKTSISLLKQNTNIQVKHYSYPEGQKKHYNDEVISCLKKYNIICCPTAIEGVNKAGDDLFLLKRIMVC